MNEVRPARPHRKVTEDGRRMREVLSYSRRGSRFTPTQQEAWDAYADRWVIPDEAVEAADFSLADWFGREAPLVVEIGPGVGEATAALAAVRPEQDILALEVWRPGVAAGLGRVGETDATNVRFCSVDAVWCLEQLIPPGGLAELWTFFPDPWPKKRHHKRRLIQPAFVERLLRALKDGGELRLATDWQPYAEHMLAVLQTFPALENLAGETLYVDRHSERPITRFERRGQRLGHGVWDLAFRKHATT